MMSAPLAGRTRNKYVALVLPLLVAQPASAASLDQRALEANAPMVVSEDIRDLPLTDVPAAKGGDTLALLISGAGGWADLDRTLSAELASRGMPVIGLNSLQYFWHARTPDRTARDVAQVLRHYLSVWHRSRVVLIGYSVGADVLPFVVNRLPPDLRARLTSVNLLGASPNASFEISVGELIHTRSAPAMPVAPEVQRIRDVPVLCLYGRGERDSPCPSLPPATASSVRIGTGHHFGEEYSSLAEQIAAFAARSGS
jgi:type IV secretory pathway VirJ component